MKQPLTAIVMNGSVALRYLDRTPPDLDEVRGALSRVIRDSHRADDVFESIRALFRKGDQQSEPMPTSYRIRRWLPTRFP